MPIVGPAARWMGFAGLLPQLAVVIVLGIGQPYTQIAGVLVEQVAMVLALLYAALILSFLGGIWWGFAMVRTQGQGRLAAVAVVPSLVAFALASLGLSDGRAIGDTLVMLGVAILLTLLVDHRLARGGHAPAGWMMLRAPLSLGLGALTIVAGLLAAHSGGLA